MKLVRLALPWLFAAGFVFLLWRYVVPLFAPDEPEVDIQTTVIRRGDLRSSVPSDGMVVPSVLVEVKSKASGVVQKIAVEPGDQVQAGDVLVELDRKDIEARLRETRAGLESAQAQFELTRRNLSPEQRASLESGVRQAEIGVREAELALADAETSNRRMAELHERGYATDAEVDAVRIAVDNARERLASANENLSSAREQLAIGAAGAEQEEIAVARANVTRAQAQMDNVLEELANTTIRAPQDGTVLTRPVEVGTAVASGTSGQTGGTTVAMIGDLSTLYVKANIEETDLGRVSVGQPTRITFDAYAGWLWRGTVLKVYPQGEGGEGQQVGVRFPVDIAIDLTSARQDSSGADTFMSRGGRGGGGRGGRGGGRGGGGGRGMPPPAAPAAGEPAAAEDEAALPTLFPQMTASVEIVLEDHPDVLIVPAQYIRYEEGKPYVEVTESAETPEVRVRREVALGFSDGLRFEVTSGVEEGETLVLERVIEES